MASLDAVAAEAAYRARRRYGRITEGKLERWYGRDVLDSFLLAATGCYVPIPIMGSPAALLRGAVVTKPWWEIVAKKIRHDQRGGFASIDDLVREAIAGGKLQTRRFHKAGNTGIASGGVDLFSIGGIPTFGVQPLDAPTGTAFTRTWTGALGQLNAQAGDTQHISKVMAQGSQVGSLMVLDRVFGVMTVQNPGVSSIAVTGTQARYTGAAGTSSYAAGCVLWNRVLGALAATAHNITYTYTDQDGNGGASTGAVTGRSAAAADQIDMVARQWAAPMAAGDIGVRQITAIQFSASPATGTVEHGIIRPLAIVPLLAPGMMYSLDGINSCFNLIQVQNDACITLLDFFKSGTTGNTIQGLIEFVSG